MSFVQNFLAERRRRALGQIMGHIEREVFPHLPAKDQDRLRARVRGSLTEYHESVVDLVKSSVNDGTVANEEALRVLARVDSHLAEQRAERRGL